MRRHLLPRSRAFTLSTSPVVSATRPPGAISAAIFCRWTIAAMLDKYGFDLLYDRYCGFYRSVDGMARGVLALRAGVPSLHRLLRRLGLLRWDLYLNLSDITYVIARKR
jgi:hypothetical protein